MLLGAVEGTTPVPLARLGEPMGPVRLGRPVARVRLMAAKVAPLVQVRQEQVPPPHRAPEVPAR